MENFQNQNTIIGSNEIQVPKKKRGLGIALLVIIILITGVVIGLFFTNIGLKTLNNFFPSAKRTFNIVKGQKAENYSQTITGELDEEKISVSGFGNIDGDSRLSLVLPAKYIFPASTVIKSNGLPRTIERIKNIIYVEDDYDSTFHELKNGIFPANLAKILLGLSYSNTLDALALSLDSIEIQSGKDTIILSAENIPLNTLTKNSPSESLANLSVEIDKNSYTIKSFLINWKEGDALNNIKTTFEYGTNSNKIETPSINKFGDFIARESVYIRTDTTGTHDYLWHEWEKNYFGCTQCVNKIGDLDKDGFKNIDEFIFGTNPTKADTSENGKNDLLELRGKINPSTRKGIPQNYEDSISLFLAPEPHISIGSAKVRSSVVVRDKFTIPVIAKKIAFDYLFSGNPDGGDYFTVFLDDKLLFKAIAQRGDTGRKAEIPTIDIKGKTGSLIFMMNSYGPAEPDQKLLFDPASIKFGY